MNKNKKDEVLLNEDIRARELRCVGDDGTQYGIISTDEAQRIADEKGLDLLLMTASATPPVAKIMDYGKFKYEKEKKQKEAKKNQKKIDVKEVKLSVKIAQNDVNFKVKQAREFLEKEKHVKFRVFLKGREMSNPEAGVEVLKKVWPMVEDLGELEKEPFAEGRYINMYVTPKKK